MHVWAAAFGPGLELLEGPQRQEGGVSGYSPREVGGGSEVSVPCGYIQVESMSTVTNGHRRQPPASGRVWTEEDNGIRHYDLSFTHRELSLSAENSGQDSLPTDNPHTQEKGQTLEVLQLLECGQI